MRLYIGSIAYGSGPSELRKFLADKGVEVLDLIWPRDNNGLRPFCFIDVPDEDGERLISELHGQEFNGRTIKVSSARPKATLHRD